MTVNEVGSFLNIPREQVIAIIEIGRQLPDSNNPVKLSANKIGDDYSIEEEQLDAYIAQFEAEQPGRHPPTAVRRELLVEAKHKCAICRESVPVFQFHHMLEWEKVKHHDAKDMLGLCGTCHDKCTVGKIDKKAQYRYKALLKEIYYPPALNAADVSTDIKRSRDLKTLRNIFESINTKNVDLFLYEASCNYMLYSFATFYWEGLEPQFESANFHLYDKTADDLLRSFHSGVAQMMAASYDMHLVSSGKKLTFGDVPTHHGWHKNANRFRAGLNVADPAYRQLLVYLKENYMELDFEETDKIARAAYVEYMKED